MRRDVTILMRHVAGLVAKDGAEGVFAAALPDGRAVALKIADGANRARPPVMVAALERIGVDVGAVADARAQQILGHGRPVGQVRAVLAVTAIPFVTLDDPHYGEARRRSRRSCAGSSPRTRRSSPTSAPARTSSARTRRVHRSR